MKFSILVPVYNTEKYLKECVDSLINQTYQGDYEIILVDDGSTDSSGKICDDYLSVYPKKIKVIHKSNEGPFLTRYTGFKNAIGEYCLFIDSDDFWEPDLLETLSICIDNNEGVDIVTFLYNYYKDDKKITGSKCPLKPDYLYYEDKSDIYESLISNNYFVSLCTKAVKTDILKKDTTDYQKYKDKRWGEDLFMSLYCLTQADKIVCLDKSLYNYRIINNGLTRSFSLNSLNNKNTLFVYERYREYLPLWNMDDNEHIDKLNARFFNEVIYTFCEFYINATSQNEKRVLMEYDWDAMLPEDMIKSEYNRFEKKEYRKIYKAIKNHNILFIEFFFFKKYLYQQYKKIKRLLFTGR